MSAMATIIGQSPIIGLAAARQREAFARYEAARVMWLPSIRAGLSYHHHDGPLQASNGVIASLSRSSLQTGMGVQAVGAGTTPTPGVIAQFHAADAVFQPRIVGQTAAARSHAVEASTNDALLEGSLAYLELLRARQMHAISADTLRRSEELARLTQSFADAGQGPRADADRARTEAHLRRSELARAEEMIEVANARLLESLSLEPGMIVLPVEENVIPIDLVEADVPAGELLTIGLSNRPELKEAQHLVREAVARYQRERYAPLLPSVLLGVSQTGFGGGPGGAIGSFDSRFDFDAVAFWEVRNLGFGELSAREQTRAVQQQRQLERLRWMDRVAREILEAHAQVRSRRQQIAHAESAVAAAQDSFQRNQQRIHDGVGLPLEVLQSIQALDASQRDYLRAVADYNEAQFRLHRALGWAIR